MSFFLSKLTRKIYGKGLYFWEHVHKRHSCISNNVNTFSFFYPCSWDHQYHVTGHSSWAPAGPDTIKVFVSQHVCVCVCAGLGVYPHGSQADVFSLIFPLRRTNNKRLLFFPFNLYSEFEFICSSSSLFSHSAHFAYYLYIFLIVAGCVKYDFWACP